MTPQQLAKSGSEHAHQTAVFAWAAVTQQYGTAIAKRWADGELKLGTDCMYPIVPVPELRWLHAIANGGARGDDAKSRAIRGGQLKAEGVKSGVSDISLPVKRGRYSGLYIELKKEKGKPSPEQKEFGAFVLEQGFGFAICYGWEEAVKVITDYLNWSEPDVQIS
jgi:hypothetical protein